MWGIVVSAVERPQPQHKARPSAAQQAHSILKKVGSTASSAPACCQTSTVFCMYSRSRAQHGRLSGWLHGPQLHGRQGTRDVRSLRLRRVRRRRRSRLHGRTAGVQTPAALRWSAGPGRPTATLSRRPPRRRQQLARGRAERRRRLRSQPPTAPGDATSCTTSSSRCSSSSSSSSSRVSSCPGSCRGNSSLR